MAEYSRLVILQVQESKIQSRRTRVWNSTSLTIIIDFRHAMRCCASPFCALQERRACSLPPLLACLLPCSLAYSLARSVVIPPIRSSSPAGAEQSCAAVEKGNKKKDQGMPSRRQTPNMQAGRHIQSCFPSGCGREKSRHTMTCLSKQPAQNVSRTPTDTHRLAYSLFWHLYLYPFPTPPAQLSPPPDSAGTPQCHSSRTAGTTVHLRPAHFFDPQDD